MGGGRDWAALAASGGLEKLKVGELKEYLKAAGMSQTGEKGTLMFRIRAHLDGERLRVDGRNPATLKAAELKKECAKRGLSPMGYPDELLESLMGWLKAHGGDDKGKGGDAAVTAGGDKQGQQHTQEDESGENAALALVHRILELSEAEDWGAILSLGAGGAASAAGAGPLSRQSPTALLRKAYHRLSLNVHPDKLRGVPEATRAFQAVVMAFERLSAPEEAEEEAAAAAGGKGKKAKEGKARTIARSNEGCCRTRVFCPRCKEEWGLPVQGLPDYCYNYFMMGLKTYTCATCLLEFGCLTAVHRCPHCRRTFEYDPHDYHRHVLCGNKGCTRTFGFYCFPVSDRVEKEMRAQLKAEQEQRLRARESKLARLARSKRKAAAAAEGEDEGDAKLKLRLFVQGLLDECPRCGEAPDCAPEDRAAHQEHLRACAQDTAKARAHQQRLRDEERKQAAQEARQAAQEDLQSLRTWEFLGGKEGDLWLLTDDQLARRCREKGILPAEADDEKESAAAAAAAPSATTAKQPKPMSKEEMIARLVAHKDGQLLLTDGKGTGEESPPKAKRRKMTRESLPDNLYTMSVAQLKAVCAAHGFVPKSSSQGGIIKEVEREVAKAEGPEEIFLIED